MTFPALIPSSRTFVPGDYPGTAYQGISGAENRVRNSNVLTDSTLTLEFIGLDESQVLALLLHYQARRGSFGNFSLPIEVWNGVGNVADYTLQGYAWSYEESPVVEDYPCGGHRVQVKLSTAVAPTPDVTSFTTTIITTLTAGMGRAANGGAFGITVALAPGEPGVFVEVPSLLRALKVNFFPSGVEV
jgi:hypothetical protein